MKRAMFPAALLILLAASVTAGPPPTIWFQDSFDTYGDGKLAEVGGEKWMYAAVIEPGKTSPWPAGTTDVNVKSGLGDCTNNPMTNHKYVVMQGYQGNFSGTVLKGIAAETERSAPIGWDSLAAGNVQILYFKMKRAYDELTDPPLHAGVYLIDNDPYNPQPIMGWQANTHAVKAQLHLPTFTGEPLPGGNWSSPEGNLWVWSPLDNSCHEFTAIYDPNTGEVKFYVDSNPTPLWTANAGAGRVSRSVYVRDYIWHSGGQADVLLIDDLAVGTTARPVVTAPIGGVFLTTATPAITWTNAGSGMTAYQVRVCSADNPAGPIVYDSGELAGSATSITTTALPTDQHLWAFVNEKYGAVWTGWSVQGNGGFYCVTSPPTTPTVTYPSGTVVGAKPSVIFTGGVLHNQFEVKITTDPAGSILVWASGVKDSLLNGASCESLLIPGTQYYAFARAMNPIGASDWSAPSAFQVTRIGEGVDFMGMEETWGSQAVYEHSDEAPNDGFGTECGGGMNWLNIKWQVLPDPLNRFEDTNHVKPNYQPCDWWPDQQPGEMLRDDPGYFIIPPIPDRPAPSYVLDIWDTGSNWNDNSMRLHRVAGLDLNKGVTFMTYARGRCYEGENCGGHSARQIAQEAQIYIMDDYGAGKCMASFRYGQSMAGICTNAVAWDEESYTDNQEPDRPGQGWHLVRITGRNRIIGDPSTAEWNYYLDENPIPLLTSTGTMPQSIAPYGSIVDGIAIGQGDGGIVGNWQYDWVAVNTDGDYAPGEWGAGGSYPTVSAMKAAGATGPIVITGETVITAVMRDESGIQLGFSVQDVNTTDHAGLYIETSDTQDGKVAVGNKVTNISGLLSHEECLGPVLRTAGFTVTTDTAEVRPIAMSQKSLLGAREAPTTGAPNAGMLVRLCGKVTAVVYTGSGAKAVYLDDGSGLVDGRTIDGDPEAKGVRILARDISFEPFYGEVGEYYQVDGISTCETWVEGNVSKTVETLLGPRFTRILPPP